MLNDRSPFDNQGMGPATPQTARFTGTKYLFRRKLLRLVGASFFVYDQAGSLVLFADQKGFKLKEDIRIYTGEDKTVEVLRVGARSVLDFGATYDVFDSASNQKLGALRRRGLKSIARDEWQILDAQDREMGLIVEDSLVLALIRRFIELVSLLLPQKYTITIGNRQVGQFAQAFNPFSSKIEADFTADTAGVLDRRLALAAGVLMCAIEGRQR